MDNGPILKSVSRQLIELAAASPPLHSFNRQFVRLLLDGTQALAVTLWLVSRDELTLSEEIEESVGAIAGIKLPSKEQERDLRRAYEHGETVVRENRPAAFDPLVAEQEARRVLAFVPLAGAGGSFGVARLVFPPLSDGELRDKARLAESVCGYYAFYDAVRVIQVRHRERQDIDRLSKAVLQLQHYSFSRSLPEVAVNSAMELTPRLERVSFLTADKTGSLQIAAVSSVSSPDRKGPWAKLLCEMAQVILQRGEPLEYVLEQSAASEIEEPELREYVNSYGVMTGVKSLLAYPLRFGERKLGAMVFESFQEAPLSGFEKMLCAVFAAHAGSALGNNADFRRVPLSRLLSRGLDEGRRKTRRGRQGLRTGWKVALALLAAGAAVWFVGFHKVPEKVGAACFVAPYVSRVVTAKVAGEIAGVDFEHGEIVKESQVLIRQRADLTELSLSRALENLQGIKANMQRLRGEANTPRADRPQGNVLAQIVVLEHAFAAEQHEVEILRQQLQDCTLSAPISGAVISPENPKAMVGMVVRPGEPLCEIGEIEEKVRIRIALPEEHMPEVEENREVEISLQPFVAGEVIKGRIESIAARSTTYKNANVFMVDVIVANRRVEDISGAGPGDYLLKPGMTGKARIKMGGDSTYFRIYARMLLRKLRYWLF